MSEPGALSLVSPVQLELCTPFSSLEARFLKGEVSLALAVLTLLTYVKLVIFIDF